MYLFRFLIAWANAPFTIIGGIAVVFALLQMSGLLGLLAGGHAEGGDHDVDGGHDVDGDADGDADHDVDGDHDADHDHDHDQDAEQQSLGSIVTGPLGFGKIPFSIIWQTYAVIFAATGLALNARYLTAPHGVPMVTMAWSLPISLVAGYLMVALVARVFGPVLSTKDQEATSRAQLVGHEGVVISTNVTTEFGEIRIRDKSGHDLRVLCRLAEGAVVPVEKQRVVVVDYEETRGELLVAPLDHDEPPHRQVH